MRADDIDRADWILVGHSHFDHLWGAERIATQTGATVVGSYETIRVMAAQGVPEEQLMPVSGGERVRLADDVFVSVFPSLHSCVWVDLKFQQPDEVCIGDLGVTHQERVERFAKLKSMLGGMTPDVVAHLLASNQDPRGDGGALVYLIETPDGTLLYQDTSGYWTGIAHDFRPDVAILAAAGAATSTASRCRARSPSSWPVRPRWCGRGPSSSRTTTTGCPASRSRPSSARSARHSRATHRAPSSAELDYLDGHRLFG